MGNEQPAATGEKHPGLQYIDTSGASNDEPRYLWLITDKNYGELRKIEGCGNLGDLGATKTDATHILDFAKGLGIPDENIFRDDAPTIEDLKATYKKLLTITRDLSVA